MAVAPVAMLPPVAMMPPATVMARTAMIPRAAKMPPAVEGGALSGNTTPKQDRRGARGQGKTLQEKRTPRRLRRRGVCGKRRIGKLGMRAKVGLRRQNAVKRMLHIDTLAQQ